MAAARTASARSTASPKARSKASPRIDAVAAEEATAIDARIDAIMRELKAQSSEARRASIARYAIPIDRAFGVGMADIQAIGKRVGRDQALADALWRTGVYEARLLAAYVGDHAALSSAQMDRWCRDFDNWAVCDTLCCALFHRCPHAWRQAEKWAKRRGEFQRRAAFALLVGLALHDKHAEDARFLRGIELIENAAEDERHFVRKAVDWALRTIGARNRVLHRASVAAAKRLSASTNPTARGIGKNAHAQLMRPMVVERVEKRARIAKPKPPARARAKKKQPS